MTQGTAATYYDAITGYLKGNNLNWIVEQVEEEISRGKIVTKAIRDLKFRQNDVGEYPIFKKEGTRKQEAKSKEEISTSEPYDDQEKLNLLLCSIEELLKINVVEENIMSNLKDLGFNIDEIQIRPDDRANEVVSITQESISHEKDSVESLLSAIRDLKNS